MKNYKLWATDGEAYYDLAQLADMGYSPKRSVWPAPGKAFKADGTELESADKEQLRGCERRGGSLRTETVKLIAADKSTPQQLPAHRARLYGRCRRCASNPTNSRVTIVKTKRGVTLDLLSCVWNYSTISGRSAKAGGSTQKVPSANSRSK